MAQDVNQNRKKKQSAYKSLQNMVGLRDGKGIVDDIIAFRNMELLAHDRGHMLERGNYNMVLSGSPGTAKTAYARLIADIFYEIGITSKPGCVEVSRAELVGKYVGHTEEKTTEVIQSAYGKVLFIDEAYALADGDEAGSYGNEAITILIREMENNRDNLVVIVAGYKDRMESFLASNPGLRSRFGYFVDFPDYNVEELIKITHIMAKDKGFIIDNDAEKELEKIYAAQMREPDFGNGRFCRNVIEHAIHKHAKNILLLGNTNEVSDDILFSLSAADIVMPKGFEKAERRIVGF
jgi:SpoVK/Ycf46/Vps4 family AAA+-type ATPase